MKTISNDRRKQIIESLLEKHSLNPENLYCQFTGAPIGQLDIDESILLWDSIDPTMDDEEIMDELLVRTICSMRPSPAWNYVRQETLNRMRISNPTRLCAYLMARFYEPRDHAYDRLKRSMDQRITDGLNRIICYAKLTESQVDPLVMKQFTTLLLLLDASFDLSICDMIPDFPRAPQDIQLDLLATYIPTLQSYYDLLVAKKLKMEKEARLHESWLANGGNRHVRDAAIEAFKEVRPRTESQQKADTKKAAENAMLAALTSIMNGDESNHEPANPTPLKPAGTFKLKLAGVAK